LENRENKNPSSALAQTKEADAIASKKWIHVVAK
jgi:hypothetical protein